MEDFPKKFVEKLLIFKDMYPENIVAVGRKKAFMKKLEYIRFELQATPFIEDT